MSLIELAVAGAPTALGNPIITEDQIRGWILAGQGFGATTTKLTASGAPTVGLSLFNPLASGKSLYVYSIRAAVAASQFGVLNLTTTDPTLGTTVTPLSLKAGSGLTSVASVTSTNTNVTPAGTSFDSFEVLGNAQLEMLTNGAILYLPAGVASGVACYLTIGATAWYTNMRWVEV